MNKELMLVEMEIHHDAAHIVPIDWHIGVPIPIEIRHEPRAAWRDPFSAASDSRVHRHSLLELNQD